jgi:large subunit ribosomal protein L10
VLRAEKARIIGDLGGVFASTGVVVITHYKGLSVPEITDLRGKVRQAGGMFRVTKNSLSKRALTGTPFEGIADLFKGPTAIAWSADPVAVPKVVVEYARRNEKLAIIGGGLGSTLLDREAVRALAELPSLDELRARFIGLLQAPAARLVGLLQAPGGQLARVMAAHAEAAGDAEPAEDKQSAEDAQLAADAQPAEGVQSTEDAQSAEGTQPAEATLSAENAQS